MSDNINDHVTALDVLAYGTDLKKYIAIAPFLSPDQKQSFLKEIWPITLVTACLRTNSKDDADPDESPNYNQDLIDLIAIRKKIDEVEAEIKQQYEQLRRSTQQCINELENSGAKSENNILHDKYRVVKRMSDSLDTIEKDNALSPTEKLSRGEAAINATLNATDYGIQKNKEAYRHAFNQNRQPTGKEILEAHRHPVIDRLLIVIKAIFGSKKEKVDSQSNPNSYRLWNKPLPPTKTAKLLNIASLSRSS